MSNLVFAKRLTNTGRVDYIRDNKGNLLLHGIRDYEYDHANGVTLVREGALATQSACNGDGVRVSKAADGTTRQYVLDLATALAVVISNTEAIYPFVLDIIAQQRAGPHWRWPRTCSQLSA